MRPTSTQVFAFHDFLDSDLLNDLFEGDLAYAETVFGDFLRDLPSYFSEIEDAYCHENVTDLRKAVHKCKTLLGFVGLTRVQQIYQDMEYKCDESADINQLKYNFLTLQQETEAGKEIIRQEFERLKMHNAESK